MRIYALLNVLIHGFISFFLEMVSSDKYSFKLSIDDDCVADLVLDMILKSES